MSKTMQQFEARLERLEKELAEVKATLVRKPEVPWYRQIVGDFAGDEAYAEIVRLGRQIRMGYSKRKVPKASRKRDRYSSNCSSEAVQNIR